VFAPNTEETVLRLMRLMAEQNGLPFANISATDVTRETPQAWFGIAGLESEAALLQFLNQNPNITQTGSHSYLHF